MTTNDIDIFEKELEDRTKLCCALADKDVEIESLRSRLAELREAASELADLMQGVIDGEYTPDSFTLQPIRAVLGESDE